MKQLATKSIVLGRIDFGESDRILTLLTSDHGKLSVIAKGVRKPKSRMAGGIELFSVTDIVFIDGKSDMKTLVSAQLNKNYSHIVQDMPRSMLAYDVLKYTNKYTESVCEDSYFELVQTVLQVLDDIVLPLALVWLWFGVHILQISGHGINVSTDAHGHKMNADDSFTFDYQNMAFQTHPSGHYTSRHIKLIRLSQTALIKQLSSVEQGGVIAEDLRQLITECIKYNA